MKDPDGPRFFGGAKKPLQGRMKPVEGTDDELAALMEFVYRQSGAPDVRRRRWPSRARRSSPT